jgi:hypothetical protein
MTEEKLVRDEGRSTDAITTGDGTHQDYRLTLQRD